MGGSKSRKKKRAKTAKGAKATRYNPSEDRPLTNLSITNSREN